MIARVAVENTTYAFDREFSYLVPSHMQQELSPGCRVLVPFGRANRSRQGLVLELEQEMPERQEDQSRLKALCRQLDETPLLDEEQLWLVKWLHKRVFCTYYEALRAVVPGGLTFRVRMLCAKGPEEDFPQAPSDGQQRIWEYLCAHKKPVELDQLLEELKMNGRNPDLQQLVQCGALLMMEDVKEKSADSREIMVRLNEERVEKMQEQGIRLTAVRRQVIELLRQAPTASLKELCYYTGTTRQTIDKMEQAGLVSYYGRQIFRSPYANRTTAAPQQITLDAAQARALEQLWQLWLQQRESGTLSALLYGVTGSGKSQVYLQLVEQVRARGKGVIILVPEISLTPQTVELFSRRFGQRVAVLHSGLTMAERADEYKRIRKGLADVVVGTRSAVFAPLREIGLIVIDEEQESAYASQSSPRYHARDIAKARCRWHKAMLLLASATPGVETYYQAKRGRIHLVELTRRYLGNQLPKVQIVDMNQSYGFDISQELTAELAENLVAGQQSILLLNRRGYHTVVRCNGCGKVAKCPNCSVALTYHHANGQLMCHYCGYSRRMEENCPNCGSPLISYNGSGTQRIEDELHRIFPQTQILRVDMDTTMSRMSHETKFNDFAAGKYQIMVGTQMVAKGLNFPNVTLVGVLNADQSIYAQDFRGCERAFSLLTQVVGRCGRGTLPGRALIQTASPDHPVIRQAARQDYESFYQDEIKARKLALYPPFCVLCQVGFSGESEELVRKAAFWFAQQFRKKASGEYSDLPLRMMNPCEPIISRIAGKYRYGIVIKCRAEERFYLMMWELLRQFDGDKQHRQVHIWVDLNGNDV